MINLYSLRWSMIGNIAMCENGAYIKADSTLDRITFLLITPDGETHFLDSCELSEKNDKRFRDELARELIIDILEKEDPDA